jgi:arginyl-tRNA synthetase
MFKKELAKLLSKAVRLKVEDVEKLIEVPPSLELGDYSFPCFVLSKKFKKSPNEIAEELVGKLSGNLSVEFDRIEVSGAYLNFFVDKKKLGKAVLKINANYGRAKVGKKKNVVIDFSAPNIGKPMHIGHIRSTIIGDSLMRIYDFLGYNSVGINYLGDVGLHIGKLIVAYEKWLNKDALKKDPVKELLRLYVKFCSKEDSKISEGLEEDMQDNEWTNQAKAKLKLLELGDKKTKKIWEDIHKYSGKGFDKVYDMLNIRFNESVGQSEFRDEGKNILINGLKKGVVHREDDGALFVNLKSGNEEKKKYVLRSNETASYITYDLGAAVERFKKYKFDKMIYVTDFRQAEHFSSLFLTLDMFGYDFVDKMVHLGFGTVKFGDEIIASRKGNIILLEEVLKKTIDKAHKEIKKRKTKGNGEKVGVGAIKYIILKNRPAEDVHFSWENALAFEGNSGPYLQYSYARACSIIKKAGNVNKSSIKIDELSKEEIALISKISKFPEVVLISGERMNPSLIANYCYDLAKVFNEFYHACKVIGSSREVFRLRLIDSFRTCLKNGLYLLGIEVMDEM